MIRIEDIREICMDLPGVTEDIKWEDHLCFNIGGKMFLITSPDKVPPSASFKVSEQEFESMIENDRFEPASYLARYKWVFVDDIALLSKEEWVLFINRSFQLIAEKLPRKIKKEIGLK